MDAYDRFCELSFKCAKGYMIITRYPKATFTGRDECKQDEWSDFQTQIYHDVHFAAIFIVRILKSLRLSSRPSPLPVQLNTT